jgi:CheY-like chemotaxis protein
LHKATALTVDFLHNLLPPRRRAVSGSAKRIYKGSFAAPDAARRRHGDVAKGYARSLVDDDDDLQFVMRQYLEPQGYKLISAQSGVELINQLDIAHPDIILLDLGLPDHGGLSLLSVIRSKSNSPVIVVSGRKETSDRIVGLEMGADDYLVKPFEMHELAARIKAVLRRSKDTPGERD